MVLDFGIIKSGLFPASDAAGEGVAAPIVNQIIWKDVGIGIIPIGAIVAYHKDLFTTAPPLLPNYVECNGQVLSDGDSPLDGKTIPNLNVSTYLRGAVASGGTGGSTNHTHQISGYTVNNNYRSSVQSGTGIYVAKNLHNHNIGTKTSTGAEPKYMNVIWIMRIK